MAIVTCKSYQAQAFFFKFIPSIFKFYLTLPANRTPPHEIEVCEIVEKISMMKPS
jgi:hypothetical protein